MSKLIDLNPIEEIDGAKDLLHIYDESGNEDKKTTPDALLSGVNSEIEDIKKVIPETATEENPLLDKTTFENSFTPAQKAALNSGITNQKLNFLDELVNENKDNIRTLSDIIADIDEKAIQAKGQITSGNLNNYRRAGMWRTTNADNISNLPPNMGNGYGQLLVISGDDDAYPTQIFSVEGDDNNDIWFRKYHSDDDDNDGWTRWYKFITSENMYFNKNTGTLTINI